MTTDPHRRGRPVTPDNASEVIDLVLHPDERMAGCLVFLLLDDNGHLLAPFLIEEPPPGISRRAREQGLRRLFDEFGSEGAATVAFARGRTGSLLLHDEDREWHQLVLEAAHTTHTRLLGAWLATDAGVRAFPVPLAETLSA